MWLTALCIIAMPVNTSTWHAVLALFESPRTASDSLAHVRHSLHHGHHVAHSTTPHTGNPGIIVAGLYSRALCSQSGKMWAMMWASCWQDAISVVNVYDGLTRWRLLSSPAGTLEAALCLADGGPLRQSAADH